MKYNVPTEKGYYGSYGGKFVPEILVPVLGELQQAYEEAWQDEEFITEYRELLKDYVGRPTKLTFASRLTSHFGKARIYLKREDLCHTGAHKINNAAGQALLALRMGKQRIIAETGAGQHGVATATACAKFGLQCIVYMGEEDMKRQELNVRRMQLLGAEVRPVTSGSRTLKDATNEAIRDWVSHVESTFYIIGSVVGPHPYPQMVRNFQRIIGDETKQQLAEVTGHQAPDYLVACVGGGSNAIGLFYPFIEDPSVKMYGLEASGHGIGTEKTAATLTMGEPGILHGSLSYLLHNSEGQIQLAHSISAGLDYPGIGPEHSFLHDSKRVKYIGISDEQAMKGVKLLSQTEGIIPALETAHAVAYLEELVPRTNQDEILVLNCSGRGDKDMTTISENL